MYLSVQRRIAMKLGQKIFTIAIVALAGMAAIATSGYIGMNAATQTLRGVYQNQVVPLQDIKEVADLYAVDIVDISHKARNKNIDFNVARTRIEQAEVKIADIWRKYLATQLEAKELALVAEIEKLRATSVAPINKLKGILGAGDAEQLAEFTRTELYPTIEPLSDKFSELIQLQLVVAKEDYEESVAEQRTLSRINIAVILIASIISIALALFIARQVHAEVGGEPAEVAERVAEIAAGNLGHRIEVHAGLEKSVVASMEKMRASLHDIITSIRANSDLLKADAEAMADNGKQVMKSAAVQNEATSAIAAAVEEMSVNVTHISDCATDAHQSSQVSGEAVIHGINVVQVSVQGMNGIMTAADATASDIRQLAEESSKIGEIINAIKGIADQTNLLALNAAIEAARAGEAGRGFAVVADEVRKLAEHTGTSTAEIIAMVETIQAGTGHALESTAASQDRVKEGVRLANDTGASMQEVKNRINATLDSVRTITDALSEQSAASQQIGRDIERIAQMSDENANAVNRLNDHASHIKELALELNGLVGSFRL
jgi:methyl-accepting chemotaxis protein